MYDMKPYLKTIDEVVERGPYRDDWASLQQHETPKWYKNAKFGIFIHWGVYSVPAYDSEWYPRNMYIQGSAAYEHHVKTYGPQKDFGYKSFIPMFRAEKFDPDAWAQLFKEAGARFVVPVAEHHDGFQMYASEISHWNAAEMGPHRDVVRELREAFEKQGLTLGVSTHRIEHWFFLGHGKLFDSDIREPLERGDLYWPSMPEPENHHELYPEYEPTEEYLQDWMVRTCELIDRFRPKELYFDWWIQIAAAKPYLKKIAAYYYNRAAEWGEEVVIAYKHDAFLFGAAMPDVERGQFNEVKPFTWETDTAIARNSWCYTENNQFKSPSELISNLLDAVSKNGCMLLNVGPKADGTISEEDRAVLTGIGAWLKKNGEAVYDTSVWRFSGEGPTTAAEGQFSDGAATPYTSADFRFTTGNGYLYASALKAAEDGKYCITRLREADASRVANFHGIIRKIELLETGEELCWSRDTEGVHILCSHRSECPLVFRITME